MKTQISHLINGRKNVIRNMDDPKYVSAKPATSHNGFAGTNIQEREAVSKKVFHENPEVLSIITRGIALTLPIAYSCTKKSWSWGCELSEEQYTALGGTFTNGTLKAYRLIVHMDCTVSLYSFTRKSEAGQWRQSNMTDLDESFIQII